ncbi:MAG TPA: hypothetical protein VKR83_13435 [Ktedonobacteraceae bacterium]|nr:hypothetical protein [Ktedonobacteraceae bacterium]
MSQYPPNPNNPYGQNPPDPNYDQGTAYGGPPPGQGSDPYNPYPNNPPAPGTNPNPYGPYGQNSPTPTPPPNPGYPPYDPYGQTVASQNANYNPYFTAPSAPPIQPSVPPRRGLSMRVILIAVIALVLILGGIAYGFISNNNTQQNNANATATAHANATATFNAALTATAVASNFPFSANLKLNDPLSDNSRGNGWATGNGCAFQANAYHVTDSQTNTFNPCAALNTNFTNFTFQTEALLTKGDGLGITFRGNANNNQLYRFMVFTDGSYNLVVYVDPTGTNARLLKSGNITPTPNLSNTNFIAVVARGSSLAMYFNQALVTTFTDGTYTHGQIGVTAMDITNSVEAVFTNAKVWQLS